MRLHKEGRQDLNVYRTRQQILSLLTSLLRESADQGRDEDLVFGGDLDMVILEAGAEAVRAQQFLNLFRTAINQENPRALDNALKALRGIIGALVQSTEKLGRYYGSPSRQQSTLRASLIRLAYAKPDLRKDLLPLLVLTRRSAGYRGQHRASDKESAPLWESRLSAG